MQNLQDKLGKCRQYLRVGGRPRSCRCQTPCTDTQVDYCGGKKLNGGDQAAGGPAFMPTRRRRGVSANHA